MSDAVRCPKCGYVYWTRTYENWSVCDSCDYNNDRFYADGEDQPLLVSSEVIFQKIPYDLEKWGYLNPGINKIKKPKNFNRYTALMEDKNEI